MVHLETLNRIFVGPCLVNSLMTNNINTKNYIFDNLKYAHINTSKLNSIDQSKLTYKRSDLDNHVRRLYNVYKDYEINYNTFTIPLVIFGFPCIDFIKQNEYFTCENNQISFDRTFLDSPPTWDDIDDDIIC